MILRFNVDYKTLWGQSLQLVIFEPDETVLTYQMHCNQLSVWSSEIQSDSLSFLYQYRILNEDGSVVFAYGGKRKFEIKTFTSCVSIEDKWRGPYGDMPFASAVFVECFFKRLPTKEEKYPQEANLILTLNCPKIEPDRYIAVVGNQSELGNWDVKKKIRLDESGFPVWKIAFDTSKMVFPIEYKYLIVDTTTDEVLAWDGGCNRIVTGIDQNVLNVVNDEHFMRTIPAWKGAGVAIPVFSLRSKSSFGVGEFDDLKLLVNWAVKTGQKLIQTLPINDTILYHTNNDSYPYNAVSVYALHPIYLRLDNIGKIKDVERKAYYEAKKQELNDKTFVDYQHVISVKWEYFNEIYLQERTKVFKSVAYIDFFEKNRDWLVPYAAFSYLRDKNGTPEFDLWPEYSVYNKEEIESFVSFDTSHYFDIAFFYFLQFHLHKQLNDVHEYAHANGVAIKGDIPIGVSPKSVDAWVDPYLFNRNMQAGAPPDDFSTTGQNWGFPTYNWELMQKDGYRWWRNRFRKMAEYFDAYRIDHILGFFRIWEIPDKDVWGLTGSFHPSLPFSKEELESRGLWWDEDRFLKPYVREHVLCSLFGEYKDEVTEKYLFSDGWERYKFKPEFDTQKKIKKYFNQLGDSLTKKDALIRDGLYMLHSEVLFLRDSRHPDRFHPRISMQSSATFLDLPDNIRGLLESIYIDYYYHRHTEFWRQQAYKKLPALIQSTNMLVCGEDLGMIPDSVPDVMNSLEILSLEIQRMPKKPNVDFSMPQDAPYLSVCTTSTHDMNPIRAWWEEDSTVTQRFYNNALGMDGKAPPKCEQWIAERIVSQHLQCKAMWIILPWQDWISIKERLWLEDPFAERINVPSNTRNFWCYRMHIPLEILLKDNKFNAKLRRMILAAGR
jgi:4-alpha-glucanotransferase